METSVHEIGLGDSFGSASIISVFSHPSFFRQGKKRHRRVKKKKKPVIPQGNKSTEDQWGFQLSCQEAVVSYRPQIVIKRTS